MALYSSDPTAFEFVIEPGSFLDQYLRSGLGLPRPLGDLERQEVYEQMRNQEPVTPGFSVDPSKLDLREYRRPGPAYPGEDLDRDRFLRTNPRSPLSSVVTDEVVASALPAIPGGVPIPRWQQILERSGPTYSDVPLPPSRFGPLKEEFMDTFNRNPGAEPRGTVYPRYRRDRNPYFGPPIPGSLGL